MTAVDIADPKSADSGSKGAALDQYGRAYGVWAPAVAPLDEALIPDAERFAAHVRWLLDGGCHGVVIFGTTGEATSFSVEERIALLEATLAAGIPADRLIIGTGCAALTDSIRLTARAMELGCFQVLMLPPFYYKGASDAGLFASYSEVIQRVGDERLRIYLYHFPRLSGVPITPGLVELLISAYPDQVVGLKDSSGDAESTKAFIGDFPGFAVFPGTESLMLPMLELGGAGCISASANVNAGGLRRLYEAWSSDDPGAAQIQAELTAVREALQAHPLIPALKRLIADHRGDPGWLRIRPPLLPLSEDAAGTLTDSLKQTGFRIPPT